MQKRQLHQEREKFSCAKSFPTARNLFKKLFQRRELTQQDNQLKYILRTRAWIIYCFYIVSQIGLWIEGEANWQSEDISCFSEEVREALVNDSLLSSGKENDDCAPMEFNEELVEHIRPGVQYI